MSSIPPFAPFFLAAALALVLPGRARALVLVALPFLGALNLYHLPDGTLWQLSVPEQRAGAGAGGPAEPAVRLPVPHRGAARDRLRAPCSRPVRDRRRPRLRRLRPRGGVRGRSRHALRVLGADGGELGVPGVGEADRARDALRVPLPRDPGPVRSAAARRGGGARAGHRHPDVHLHRAGGRRGLAHLPRVRNQVRIPVPAQLADRRLSGSDPDRNRVPHRVHHQGRGLRARARLPRHRDAGLDRRR